MCSGWNMFSIHVKKIYYLCRIFHYISVLFIKQIEIISVIRNLGWENKWAKVHNKNWMTFKYWTYKANSHKSCALVTESMKNMKMVQNVKNVDNIENVENVENVENIENVSNISNVSNRGVKHARFLNVFGSLSLSTLLPLQSASRQYRRAHNWGWERAKIDGNSSKKDRNNMISTKL